MADTTPPLLHFVEDWCRRHGGIKVGEAWRLAALISHCDREGMSGRETVTEVLDAPWLDRALTGTGRGDPWRTVELIILNAWGSWKRATRIARLRAAQDDLKAIVPGIRLVAVDDDRTCRAALDLHRSQKVFAWNGNWPELPLGACDKDHCRCDLTLARRAGRTSPPGFRHE